MDNRLFFVLGDLLANLAVGAAAAWLSWLIIDTGWNMWLAMVVAMCLGMFLGLLLFLPLSLALGAMEVMIPVMLGGMVSGMVVGMWCAMAILTPAMAVFVGAVCGLASINLVWVINNHVRGSYTPKVGSQ